MKDYAYLLNDQLWPPTLYEVVQHNWCENEELETYTLRDTKKPSRVLWVPASDVWVVATA
jgi:hypothetical protein